MAAIDEKLEMLVDQVGRLIEGLTEFRLDMAEIKGMLRQQGETFQDLAVDITAIKDSMSAIRDSIAETDRTTRRQVETVDRLVVVVDRQAQMLDRPSIDRAVSQL